MTIKTYIATQLSVATQQTFLQINQSESENLYICIELALLLLQRFELWSKNLNIMPKNLYL